FPPPVKSHEVPLPEPASQAPRLHLTHFLTPGASGEVPEADGVPAVHGSNDVVECLSGWLDPRLDAGRKVDVGESACGLQLADGIDCGGAESSTFPQLGSKEEDGGFGGRQADIRKPVRVLANAVAG